MKAPKMTSDSYGAREDFVDEIILDDKGGEAADSADDDFNRSVDSEKLPQTKFSGNSFF